MLLRSRPLRAALVVAAMALLLLGPLVDAGAVAPAIRHAAESRVPSVVAAHGSLAAADDPVCGGTSQLAVDDLGLCTHGPDTAPAVAARNDPGAPVPTRGVTCVGDGVSGQRVEVLYVHRSGTSQASAGRRQDIERWVEQVEWTVHESARRFSGDRRVRWRTSGCDVRIASHAVSSTSMGDFNAMIDELRADGLTRSDRTYLLFVDSSRYCGIGTAPRDDRASNNAADRTAGYARVDRPCWDTGDEGYHSIAAHELFHTLGAVQASSPNGTSGAHCTDEHDLLCYDDGGGTTTVCRDGRNDTSGAGDLNDRLLDCRGDDYFNPSPGRGTYLDGAWNTADSARLHDPSAAMRSSGGGTTPKPPSPTGDPIGYVFYLLFG